MSRVGDVTVAYESWLQKYFEHTLPNQSFHAS